MLWEYEVFCSVVYDLGIRYNYVVWYTFMIKFSTYTDDLEVNVLGESGFFRLWFGRSETTGGLESL